MKFTQKAVDGLRLPAGKVEHIEWDPEFPGFGVRLRESGAARYVFQYQLGRQQRRVTLGVVTAMRLDQARKAASGVHAAVRLGHDPQGQKAELRDRADWTFEPLARRFLTVEHDRWKPRTLVEITRHLMRDAKPLHRTALASIDRRRIADLLGKLREEIGNIPANRVRSSLSMFFAWAMREALVETNPVLGTNKAPENGSRDRVLTPGEMRVIWDNLPNNDYGAIVKLLALTGARRDEIGALRWAEIDFDDQIIALPGERTKSRQPHLIPLSPAAVAILKQQRARRDGREFVFGDGPRPFSGWSKAKIQLDATIAATRGEPLPDWRMHDTRRTFSTVLHDQLGIAPHIVEALLGHVSGHRAGVAGVYNKAQYLAERRRVLDAWADHIANVVKGRPGRHSKNVVAMRRGRS
jgi:integrase